MKNVASAGKALIVSKLNKIQKASQEEGAKLISDASSSRPSDLTVATADDRSSSFEIGTSTSMKNLDDPYMEMKAFKTFVDNDEEKAKEP